jgi:hypothetical protein
MMTDNPPHPGQIFKKLFLKPLQLSAKVAAKGSGISRKITCLYDKWQNRYQCGNGGASFHSI